MRSIFVAFVLSLTTLSIHAFWECSAMCQYYLSNSSHTHPSLPDQFHESLLNVWGNSRESAYRNLVQECLACGFEGHVVGESYEVCFPQNSTDD